MYKEQTKPYLFSPTTAFPSPRPSPQGEGEHFQGCRSINRSVTIPALEKQLPLPGGEGWGEGERDVELHSQTEGLHYSGKPSSATSLLSKHFRTAAASVGGLNGLERKLRPGRRTGLCAFRSML